VGKELPHLAVELRGQGLVLDQNQGRVLDLLDEVDDAVPSCGRVEPAVAAALAQYLVVLLKKTRAVPVVQTSTSPLAKNFAIH
jgi:hypothetical protein